MTSSLTPNLLKFRNCKVMEVHLPDFDIATSELILSSFFISWVFQDTIPGLIPRFSSGPPG